MIGNPFVTSPAMSAVAASVLEAMVIRSLTVPDAGDCLNNSAAERATVPGLAL